ncbi:DNA-processing protein DprA [Novisyntrophococcus fermenticellae]|uniref:DNA-processing protein DprA n=1 Tax=Novisyntrophococcus fermenticellae TaxID=2068655 RepID=UPI001E37EAFE|nr:DNA-processing protein DprA [Novisyntrophococcus fermenticellae]
MERIRGMREERYEYYGREESKYPGRLKLLPRMPEGIYVKGKLPAEDEPVVAIAGARACSSYGRQLAFEYARILAECGVQIISGLAYGIDTGAHEGALAGGGKTFAVLGCGVDICYPKENYPLYRKMLAREGGVLSEFPPGSAPEAWHFPVRNRIISGLADAVLVVEARERSGSLITADYALEQGKLVFAIPGRVGDALSRGCNYLLYQGAGLAYQPECILEELGITSTPNHKIKYKIKNFSKEEQCVYQQLDILPKSLGELADITEYSMPVLSKILLTLQAKGFVEESYRNYWRKFGQY